VIADAESRDDEQEESAFGNAKPMLPYSSMFILGSTNPLVLFSRRLFTLNDDDDGGGADDDWDIDDFYCATETK